MLSDYIRIAYAPWFESVEFRVPAPQLRLVAEWADMVSRIVGDPRDPTMSSLRVAAVDSTHGELHFVLAGTPAGGRTEGEFCYSTDRGVVISAITRTMTVRSWRWDPASGGIGVVAADWSFLADFYDPWFDCELSIGDGWASLLHALGIWGLEVTDGPVVNGPRFLQVNEKLAGLRLYHTWPQDHVMCEIASAFELVSFAVCETCGAPGWLHDENGFLRTACAAHARGNHRG